MSKIRGQATELPSGSVLRRFWPTEYACPYCKREGVIHHDHEKLSNKGPKQYRRCTRCRLSYSVGVIAEEINRGGGEPSRIVFR